jgi:hypothetical protein
VAYTNINGAIMLAVSHKAVPQGPSSVAPSAGMVGQGLELTQSELATLARLSR